MVFYEVERFFAQQLIEMYLSYIVQQLVHRC